MAVMTEQEVNDLLEWELYIKLKELGVREGELTYLELANIKIELLTKLLMEHK